MSDFTLMQVATIQRYHWLSFLPNFKSLKLGSLILKFSACVLKFLQLAGLSRLRFVSLIILRASLNFQFCRLLFPLYHLAFESHAPTSLIASLAGLIFQFRDPFLTLMLGVFKFLQLAGLLSLKVASKLLLQQIFS